MTKKHKKKQKAFKKKNRDQTSAVATRNPRSDMAKFSVETTGLFTSPFIEIAPASITADDLKYHKIIDLVSSNIKEEDTKSNDEIGEIQIKIKKETSSDETSIFPSIIETHYFCYVPEIHIENGLIPTPYIRLCELPEKMQEVFVPWIKNSSRPYIREHHDAVYYRDFKRWFENYTDRIYIERKTTKEENV